MIASTEYQHPLAWTSANFSLNEFSLVFLPGGGNDRGLRQLIDSPVVQRLVVEYVPLTEKPSNKAIGAMCRGVLVLAASKDEHGKSVLYERTTTALPSKFESSIFLATRAFIGDHYKPGGGGDKYVQDSVS